MIAGTITGDGTHPAIAARGCNELADSGRFEIITRRINGGMNGQTERLALWGSAKNSLEAIA